MCYSALIWFSLRHKEVRKHMADKGFIAELERLQQWRGMENRWHLCNLKTKSNIYTWK